MPRHPKCHKLRHDANSSNWAEMLVFYYRQASTEDIQIARQISDWCVRLVGVINELETVDNLYARKTVEHLREVQTKDDQKVMHMQIMVDDLDLSARSKDVFILKLKGEIDF